MAGVYTVCIMEYLLVVRDGVTDKQSRGDGAVHMSIHGQEYTTKRYTVQCSIARALLYQTTVATTAAFVGKNLTDNTFHNHGDKKG
jgi:hypothetical protein